MIIPLAVHMHINAILALFMAAAAVPMASICISLFIAGRTLTKSEDRSRVGTWLGWWLFFLGMFFVCTCLLVVARWTDLEPEIDITWLSILARAIGVVALTGCLACSWIVGPLIFERIKQGSFDALIVEAARTERDYRQDVREGILDDRDTRQDSRETRQDERERRR